jgi:hypothetical protein
MVAYSILHAVLGRGAYLIFDGAFLLASTLQHVSESLPAALRQGKGNARGWVSSMLG